MASSADSNFLMIYSSNNTIKSPLNMMLVLDCKNLLLKKYLMKADKAIMANSIEERLALLDKNIAEFALELWYEQFLCMYLCFRLFK